MNDTIQYFDALDTVQCATAAESNKIVVIRNYMDAATCNRVIKDAGLLTMPNLTQPDWKIPNFKSVWPQDCNFDYYRLSDPRALDSNAINIIYIKMQACMMLLQSLTGITNNKARYHLELLHYRENGYFGRHRHNRDPQRFGIILQLSKLGVDHIAGGTVFYIDDKVIDINQHSDQGDLIIFKYDIEHEVTKVTGQTGRWTAVLPYY